MTGFEGEPLRSIDDRLLDIRWILLIGEARQLFGDDAARELWARSPLPKLGVEEARPVAPPIVPGTVAAFARACTASDPPSAVGARAMYAHYLEWCAHGQHEALGLGMFGRALTGLGHTKIKRSNVVWVGVRLTGFRGRSEP